MGENMHKVIFLNEVYAESVPYAFRPLKGLTRFRRDIRSETQLKPTINSLLPKYGIEDGTTIDEVIERQRFNVYLRGKGIVVLYPESGSNRWNTGTSLVFPYNMDPKLSLASLVALKEVYQRRESSRQLSLPNDLDKKEKDLVLLTLEYLEKDEPTSQDIRGSQENLRVDAAKNFLVAYQSLKGDASQNSKDPFLNFILLATFTAAYHRIHSIYQRFQTYFDGSPNFPKEFVEQPVKEIDLDVVLGYANEKPIKKYIEAAELKRRYERNRGSLIQLIKTRLDKRQMARR